MSEFARLAPIAAVIFFATCFSLVLCGSVVLTVVGFVSLLAIV